MQSKEKNLQEILEYTMLELSAIDSSGKRFLLENDSLSDIFFSDDDEENRIFDELEENVSIFIGIRYMYRGQVPKNLSWFDETLQQLDEKRFKEHLRCTRKQFNVVLGLIEAHPVFHGQNSDKQFSAGFQLALVLFRLGCNGQGASISKIASLFGVGDGGTIEKVTRRVFQSILSLKDKVICWPSVEERESLVQKTFHELPHCVGYVDGMEVPLINKPGIDHVSYFSKERQYSIKMQSVCDFSLFIRQVTIGYPGSVHDARTIKLAYLLIRKNTLDDNSTWLQIKPIN